jgi:DNA polymerase III alpha subunit
VARNAGIHAAAVIVADRELSHYTPLMRGSKSTVTEHDRTVRVPDPGIDWPAQGGLSGLSTLSVMREAARLIKERHGIEYTLEQHSLRGRAAEPSLHACFPAAR